MGNHNGLALNQHDNLGKARADVHGPERQDAQYRLKDAKQRAGLKAASQRRGEQAPGGDSEEKHRQHRCERLGGPLNHQAQDPRPENFARQRREACGSGETHGEAWPRRLILDGRGLLFRRAFCCAGPHQ